MHIQFNYANVESSAALEEHVERTLESEIGRLSDRLTRIEVHFSDLNGAEKSGRPDKRCLLEARPSGRDPLAIETVSDSFYQAATDAAAKLGRALSNRLER